VGISLQITPFTHLLKNNTTLSNLNSKIDAMSKTGVFYRAKQRLLTSFRDRLVSDGIGIWRIGKKECIF
jgi:hypothetical protein